MSGGLSPGGQSGFHNADAIVGQKAVGDVACSDSRCDFDFRPPSIVVSIPVAVIDVVAVVVVVIVVEFDERFVPDR